MKVLKIIGLVFLGIVVIAAIWLFTLPNEVHLERKAVINAPVEKVFAVVNDFGQTKHWNPWMKIDPEAQYTYSDNLVGAGAWYSWTSDHEEVGNGRQDILASEDNKMVKTKMAFEGMTGDYSADFMLNETEDGTELLWTFDGKGDQMMDKIFFKFSESWLGPSYDEGLVALTTYIEGLPDPEPEMEEEMMDGDSTEVVEVVEVEAAE